MSLTAISAMELENLPAIKRGPRCLIHAHRIIAAVLVCLLLNGCPTQDQTAALVGIAGTAIAALETIEGHTDAAAKIQKDFTAAQTAVLNWKKGTPTQDVAQALALLESDLNLLPISQKDQAYVELGIGTVQSILVLFPSAQPADGSPIPLAVAMHTNVPAPKTADEFKARWNALPGSLVLIR